MTKLNVWQCDICKKRFENMLNGRSVTIEISGTSMYYTNENFEFADVCQECRDTIITFITELSDHQ